MSLKVAELLKAGCHFGHQTKRWNPKMQEFIYTEKNGVHIINVNKTSAMLDAALKEVARVVKGGGSVLFVGTKKQAKHIVREAAEKCGMPYVTERWLGGMLTNNKTILNSVKEIEEIEHLLVDSKDAIITKKELGMLSKKRDRVLKNLSGVRDMKVLPELVFIIDIMNDELAVNEAKKLRIPVLAMVDTNCDPDIVDYVIPSNDDAMKSIKLIADAVSATVSANKVEKVDKAEKEAATEK